MVIFSYNHNLVVVYEVVWIKYEKINWGACWHDVLL